MMDRALDRLQAQLVAAIKAHVLRNAPPRPPVAGVHLWRCFVYLSARRRVQDGRGLPISPVEIEAAARLKGWFLTARHVEMIEAMDLAFLKAEAVPKEQRVQGPLTAALFDRALG